MKVPVNASYKRLRDLVVSLPKGTASSFIKEQSSLEYKRLFDTIRKHGQEEQLDVRIRLRKTPAQFRSTYHNLSKALIRWLGVQASPQLPTQLATCQFLADHGQNEWAILLMQEAVALIDASEDFDIGIRLGQILAGIDVAAGREMSEHYLLRDLEIKELMKIRFELPQYVEAIREVQESARFIMSRLKQSPLLLPSRKLHSFRALLLRHLVLRRVETFAQNWTAVLYHSRAASTIIEEHPGLIGVDQGQLIDELFYQVATFEVIHFEKAAMGIFWKLSSMDVASPRSELK